MSQDERQRPQRVPRQADGLNLRRYNSHVSAVAADWYANPIQDINVAPRGHYSTTADGACEVQLADGSVAYLKPRPGKDGAQVVAREKIASDLGYLLSLPVAPVLVRRPCEADGQPGFTALSLDCLPSGRLWAAGGANHLKRFVPYLEALRVFWSWLGDTDHNGHPNNLAWQLDGENVSISAFDHSYCLAHDGAAAADIPASVGYRTALLPGSSSAREATVARIEALSWPDVVSVVERLEEVLTDVERRRMLSVLEVRRSGLRRIIGC